MPPGFTESYAEARRWPGGGGRVQESAVPPERWMQQIWRHQRIHRDRLHLVDGRRIRVLHPGYWNREPGPDFTEAVLQFGDDPAVRGDVEVDRTVSGWRQHRHLGNPAYERVRLRIVWSAPATNSSPPVLALEPHLDSPLDDLAFWLDTQAPALLPGSLPGLCCAPLRELAPEQIREVVRQAAEVRLRERAATFAVRAVAAGWEQALWEGMAGALGYKHNVWPMRRLAELTPLGDAAGSGPACSVEAWEARLLGIAGFLPTELPRGPGRAQVRRLWDLWWRERDTWEGVTLPAFLWRLGGIRPANHPQRRVVLAARWRAMGALTDALDAWMRRAGSASRLAADLGAILTPPAVTEDYWIHHVTFRSETRGRRLPLLGAARVAEIALNVILPWIQARAEAAHRSDAAREAVRRFFLWPAAGDNAALRLARQRLFGEGGGPPLRSGADQQGLHQILQDFCRRAGPLCGECRFPEWIRRQGWADPNLEPGVSPSQNPGLTRPNGLPSFGESTAPR
ncbi:MAG: DUF2851 family protein [Verrucomicrobia bacterium]|nr:DUF2851 family protein [Verrucomicrobiota bacterium]